MSAVGFEEAPRTIGPGDAEYIALELNSTPVRERAFRAQQLANLFQVSTDTIYRKRREINRRGKVEVKTRADAGVYRKIPPHVIRTIYEIQLSTLHGDRSNQMMSAHSAIRMCEVNGLIPQGIVSVSRYNACLREQGYRIPEPRIRIEAKEVNERHLLDASGTEYFYLKEELDDGDFLVGIRPMIPGKPANIGYKKVRSLWLLGIIDDRSRCAFVKYYATVGEDTVTTLQFLQEAWQYHPEIPFGGMPKILQTDNSAFARNRIIEGFFDLPEINVRHTRITPYKKEGQGKIERLWLTHQNKFEQPFLAVNNKKPGYTIRLSELNELNLQWFMDYAEMPHPVDKGSTRAEVWSQDMARGILREVPDNLSELPFAVKERTLNGYGDFNIPQLRNTAHGGWYHAPTDYCGRKVLVYRNALGEVYVRDPWDPQQASVKCEPGRRETQPTWDEKDEHGNIIRIGDNYATGTGLGRKKTPTQRVLEEPEIPDGILLHPTQAMDRNTTQKMHLVSRQDEASPVENDFTEVKRQAGDYFNEDTAKAAIAELLGTSLLNIQVNFQHVWIDIERTLETTLDRQEIRLNAVKWERMMKGNAAQGGF